MKYYKIQHTGFAGSDSWFDCSVNLRDVIRFTEKEAAFDYVKHWKKNPLNKGRDVRVVEVIHKERVIVE